MRSRQASLIGPLYHAYIEKEVNAAIRTYYDLKKEHHDEYLFHRAVLYQFGCWLLEKEKVSDAVRIFETNIKEYPQYAYAHEALGEALMAAGEKDKAIESLQRSLELDPENEIAAKMLEKIRKGE